MLPAYLIAVLLATSSPVLTAHLIIDPIETQKTEWLEKLHQCENPDNIKRIVDSNGFYSYKYLMFQMATWLKYGKEFGATKENIYDDELQKIVARKMLDNGLENHWFTCSKRVSSSLGSYPSD